MPIEIDAIIAKLEWAAERGLSEFAWTASGTRIHLRRDPVAPSGPIAVSDHVTAPQVDAPKAADTTIDAPMAGLCHLAPDSARAPFVSVGDTVEEGQTICTIEAMKVMTSITATRSGTVSAILIEDGATVAAGTPLIRFEP